MCVETLCDHECFSEDVQTLDFLIGGLQLETTMFMEEFNETNYVPYYVTVRGVTGKKLWYFFW